jgi:uncharacterized protein YegL
MNPNYTHIVLLVDASGSMEPTKQATIDGINRFIREQKALPNQDRQLSVDADFSESTPNLKCTLNLVFFASDGQYSAPRTGEPGDWFGYHKFIDHKDLNEVAELTAADYTPNGGTPLLDAFCKAIREAEAFINTLNEAEKPGRVIYVSLTDGEENTSRNNSNEDLAKLIEEVQAKNRQVIYLGANQDAIKESSKYKVSKGQAMTYNATNAGYEVAFRSLSNNVLRKRSVADTNMMFACSITDDARSISAGSTSTMPTTTTSSIGGLHDVVGSVKFNISEQDDLADLLARAESKEIKNDI